MNNTENSADAPSRVTWSNIGTTEDYTTGTQGYQDLTDEESWIITAELLTESSAVIYKERSIVLCEWVGGHTPFRFTTMVFGNGCLCKDGVVNIRGAHHVIDQDIMYRYSGGKSFEEIGQVIKDTLFGMLDHSFGARVFLLHVDSKEEFQVWIPTTTDYPDTVWVQNFEADTWHVMERTMTGWGTYKEQSAVLIGDLTMKIGTMDFLIGDLLTKANTPIRLVGDSDGKIYKLDDTILNDDGSAIVNNFRTVSFTRPDNKEYQNKEMRVTQFVFEARGQAVTTEWSDDEGASWYPTSGANDVTLDASNYKFYRQDFEACPKKICFRFYNDTASSGYKIRYFGFYWVPRSGR